MSNPLCVSFPFGIGTDPLQDSAYTVIKVATIRRQDLATESETAGMKGIFSCSQARSAIAQIPLQIAGDIDPPCS